MKKPKQSSPTLPEKTASISSTGAAQELFNKLPENVRTAVNKLPEEDRTAFLDNLQPIHIKRTSSTVSGPFPPPSWIEGYESAIPGGGKLFFRLVEKEQDHRIEWEKKALVAEIRQEQYGQWFGSFISVLCIGGAVYLAMNGQTAVASILAGTSAIRLAERFIQGRRDKSQPEEKQ